MKTDDFIKALAGDEAVERGVIERSTLLGLAGAAVVAGLTFYATLGLRAGLTTHAVAVSTAIKICVTAPLAFFGVVAALRLARPGAPHGLALFLLFTPLAVLLLLLGIDFGLHGLADWRARLFGRTSSVCSALIVALSVLPFAALIHGLKNGASENPRLSGFVAGLAAAGVGATIYALHCPEDSALFMAAWYGAAALAMGVAGALAGRLLRW
ncbi:MAG: DUF1109 domain-containing protein [Hyphomicrobiales bacterium]|nr:DUF1109 domain-containing protein [Hyphomicrobiales bacterium]